MNAEGADTADKALNPLTVAEVADTLVLRAEVELKSVQRADTELTEVPLMFPPLILVAALTLAAETEVAPYMLLDETSVLADTF